MSTESENLISLGTFSTQDARLLLDALVAEDIPFSVEENSDAMRNMGVFAAANGGLCGHGCGVSICVKTEDEAKVSEIRSQVLKIEI